MHRKLTIEEVGTGVKLHTLGHYIDMHIEPQDIYNDELRTLWANAQVAMNEVQIFLEENLGENFFA